MVDVQSFVCCSFFQPEKVEADLRNKRLKGVTKRQLFRVERRPRARVDRLGVGRQSGKDGRREGFGALLSRQREK